MAAPSKFEVFQVQFSLATVAPTTDPRLEEGWAEAEDEERELALNVFAKSPLGKIKYWEGSVSAVQDENMPRTFSKSSGIFDTEVSDGGVELERLSEFLHVALLEAFKSMAPIEHVQKRLIQWDGVGHHQFKKRA